MILTSKADALRPLPAQLPGIFAYKYRLCHPLDCGANGGGYALRPLRAQLLEIFPYKYPRFQ